MKEKQFRCGDLLYRFKFDLANGTTLTEKFEIEDVSKSGRVKAMCVESEKSPKALFQGVYFDPVSELGQVKTKGTAKYALLDEDDLKKAARLVLDYVKVRLEEYKEQVRRAAKWADILEKIVKEER